MCASGSTCRRFQGSWKSKTRESVNFHWLPWQNQQLFPIASQNVIVNVKIWITNTGTNGQHCSYVQVRQPKLPIIKQWNIKKKKKKIHNTHTHFLLVQKLLLPIESEYMNTPGIVRVNQQIVMKKKSCDSQKPLSAIQYFVLLFNISVCLHLLYSTVL